MRVRDLTYNKAIYGLETGALSKKYIGSQYTKLRNEMLKQIKEINKTAYRFRRSENLSNIPTWKEVKKGSFEDISHAIHEINRILNQETLAARKTNIDKSIEGMRKVFPEVNSGNYEQYADFFEWFRENQVNKLFDSTSAVVKEFLTDRAEMSMPSKQGSWARIFVKWLWDNGYDEYAQSVGEMFFASYHR